MRFHHVLFTTDLSGSSKAAVRYAASVIEADRVTLLSLVESWPLPEWPFTPSEDFTSQSLRVASAELDKLAPLFGERSVERHVGPSLMVASDICDYARRNHCDLIVIGSHGAGVLTNLFIGSTTQRVIRLAHCPLFLVPPLTVSTEG